MGRPDKICRENGIGHCLTAPGSPTTTGKIERFHRTLRTEFLSGRLFSCLEVAQKELDSTKAMMQGKLKLKGDLPTIVRYTKASQEMTECTTRIEVIYPDEQ